MDRLEPGRAAVRAWTEAGPRAEWHHAAQARVRGALPALASALERGDGRDAIRAWTRPGMFASARRERVRAAMPVLARALDRA